MIQAYFERPQGTNDFVNGEKARKTALEQEFSGVFAAWGYKLVDTPLIEYEETIRQGLHRSEEAQLYRMFDDDGKTIALRPEMTTPVARLAATRLADEPFPLRLGYFAKTYRRVNAPGSDRVEVTQAGVELIGDHSADGDAEVIAIMAKALQQVELASFRFAIGHMGYIHALLQGLPAALQSSLRRSLAERDMVSYKHAVKAAQGQIPADATASLIELPRLRGGSDAIARARAIAGHPAAQAACDNLEELYAAFAAHGIADLIHFDLGLYLDHEYYTGVLVEGYADSLGKPICFGGRYDKLLEKFGRPAPATGCVMHIERLLSILPQQDESEGAIALYYVPETRGRAFAFARFLRERGLQVGVTRAELAPSAAAGAGRLAILRGDAELVTEDGWLSSQFETFRNAESGVPAN